MKQIVALGLMLTVPASAQEQAFRHEKAIAVLAPRAVKLDGDLKEWDLSGALDSAYEPALAPKYSGRFAFMFDANALYLGAHIVDDTPLQNAHDPQIERDNSWDGDALQVRLTADPAMPYPLTASNFTKDDPQSRDSRIVHLTFWQFTGRREPALFIQHGMDYHGDQLLTGAASGTVFKADADGKGYTIEARLPWSLLGVAAGRRRVHRDGHSIFVGQRRRHQANSQLHRRGARAGLSFSDSAELGAAGILGDGKSAAKSPPAFASGRKPAAEHQRKAAGRRRAIAERGNLGQKRRAGALAAERGFA